MYRYIKCEITLRSRQWCCSAFERIIERIKDIKRSRYWLQRWWWADSSHTIALFIWSNFSYSYSYCHWLVSSFTVYFSLLSFHHLLAYLYFCVFYYRLAYWYCYWTIKLLKWKSWFCILITYHLWSIVHMFHRPTSFIRQSTHSVRLPPSHRWTQWGQAGRQETRYAPPKIYSVPLQQPSSLS